MKLLDGEKVEMELKPAKLAFIKHYLCSIVYLLIAGLLWYVFSSSGFLDIASKISLSYKVFGALIFSAFYLVSGFVIALGFIHKVPFFANIALVIIGLCLFFHFNFESVFFFPAFSVICAAISFLIVTLYAGSHTFYITNERIILKKRFIQRDSREIFYEKISDVSLHQGIFGRIFNFGNVVPVTQSGFGMGSSTSFAGAGASTGKKVRFGIFGGGAKSIDEPRSRTYYQLFGVENPNGVKDQVIKHMHAHSPIPYLERMEKGLGGLGGLTDNGSTKEQ